MPNQKTNDRETLSPILKTKLNYQIVDRRPGDVEEIWADTKLANDELGWKAQRDLDEMTLSAWNWEKRIAAGGQRMEDGKRM